ncbi:DUF1127 domain-containing protein [Sulfitobacter geojensis]|jgi:uncharacterized protein YjiS (DUF1127 family)|uniref:DUF1127 domain-containing protein n=1 Tax=Sulfitobacter geojensis TaxID=1342299 RepID=A0AAE2VXK0_9RHOB|nr:DUF1127 domain-containing protein [Sulfitobacter geojensis]KHA51563.1 DUF1127 domain containing protein [Sulfitobacter geojensis]MBM1689034.1 DUF1127 domain-containing protein [Sulfitobacter geojensis]MBM1693101.1 DUF1127 domain-containing protein [Sulfitobacter geojensis]MBM1705267.1 DUF1127 domain-containing protein [Sulfitobacter geojensis]MBM1709325.1 DUF1127 domain-containing protein [Sulfitobacter geojensis]
MAAFDTSRPVYGSTSAVSSFITRSISAVVAWNDSRVTRSALSSLSDRELDDIGLVRGDIDAVAQTNFFR